jgi:hypothetical protein
MAEHDFIAKPVLTGYLVSYKSDTVPEASPPGPVDGNAGYKFLSDAATNVKPGDTVRVNGRVCPSIDSALEHMKAILTPPPVKRNRIGGGR